MAFRGDITSSLASGQVVHSSTPGFITSTAVTAAFFLVLVGVLRFGSLSHSVLDPDESLYLLISQGVLDGRTPYVEIWDHKPPGIYYLFALSQLIFGRSLMAIRVATCLAVTASCTLLVVFGRHRLHSSTSGYIAALLYAVFSLANDGRAANTEVFFTPFVIGGFFLVTGREALAGNRRALIGAGLCFGAALQIKYVVVFETLLALGILVAAYRRRGAPRRDAVRAVMLLGAGIVAPAGVVMLAFLSSGAFAHYWHANIIANGIHSSNTPWSATAMLQGAEVQLRNNLLLWCGVAAWLVWFTLNTDGGDRKRDYLLLAWLCLAAAGVCVTRRFYPHYSLQMLPPLSLITAWVCWRSLWAGLARRQQLACLILMLVPGVVPTIAGPLRESGATAKALMTGGELRHDEPAQIARYLNGQLTGDDYLYVADYQPILYVLVHAKRPTRYLFPQFLTSNHFSRVAGIDPVRELEAIFVGHRPQYVVAAAERRTNSRFAQALGAQLLRDYEVDRTYAGAVVYRRRPSL